jgi:hypothetical protein
LTNALVRTRRQPTVTELEAVYRDLKRAVPTLKGALRTRTLFSARPFKELLTAATRSAVPEATRRSLLTARLLDD